MIPLHLPDSSVALRGGNLPLWTADGVLLNTGIASAKDPVSMARAMAHAIDAGYLAFRAGRIPKKLYATASSPVADRIT